MYWYGIISVSAMLSITIRETILNFSAIQIREWLMLALSYAMWLYAGVFVVSRLLHLGETISVDDVEIAYYYRTGQVTSIRWDEIATLEYQEISCLLVITAPNPSRVIQVDNRMGGFIDLLNKIQDEMNKFAYKRRIRFVKK